MPVSHAEGLLPGTANAYYRPTRAAHRFDVERPFSIRQRPIQNPIPDFSPIVERPEQEHNQSAIGLHFLYMKTGLGAVNNDNNQWINST